ncbi:DUF2924 domain-containing protein [Micavibrio aeruginosavorus]|uniref:DUF2924 domain-containing protein n=1 Tax=Micavibrio aeruginosavorus TaxID=349221 RepID=UPI0005A00E2F|nr:DUF2924 domain-containing protein [Micavibrio aeruginosavorus]
MHDLSQDLSDVSGSELRKMWSDAWGLTPPHKISRPMLERSLLFKRRELAGLGLTPEQQKRLAKLVRAYKRNPESASKVPILKPGTRLVRSWKGAQYSVLVKECGFEYQGNLYKSLSEVASIITGTRWNGWVFFGLKKTPQKAGG